MTMDESVSAPRVLIVEDEEPILDGLLELFGVQDFEPEGVMDGAEALERLGQRSYDLIILDLMIPSVPGLEVLRQTRAAGNAVPVLILTALGAEADIVAGLEAGADDYVTKPFGIRELVARAQGLLRRAKVAPELPQRINVGGVLIDLDQLTISSSHSGELVALTAREGMLLQYLAARRHRAVSREELLVDVWGYRDGSMRTRTVDVHVGQLRAKLQSLTGGDRWIETVRGRGYRFAAEVE